MIAILLTAATFAAVAWAVSPPRGTCAQAWSRCPTVRRTGAVPERALIAACAFLGAVAAARGLPFGPVAMIALTCGLLVAIWAADVTRGIIPDHFTLIRSRQS